MVIVRHRQELQANISYKSYNKPKLIGQLVYDYYRPLYISLVLKHCRTGRDRNLGQRVVIIFLKPGARKD